MRERESKRERERERDRQTERETETEAQEEEAGRGAADYGEERECHVSMLEACPVIIARNAHAVLRSARMPLFCLPCRLYDFVRAVVLLICRFV